MTEKSWNLSRRQLLRGGGLAIALPLLEGMTLAEDTSARSSSAQSSTAKSSAAKSAPAKDSALPKRLVVSYIAYGVYEPKPPAGKTHHDWNWWPCAEPGPLSFNQSTAPFAPLKDYVSYLRGLDHAGGYSLGGHSSGDVFATGADMVGAEKTNNISVDQLAAKVRGQATRFPSLVLGTEGGTGPYGAARTLSHYGPGRPIPSLHKPQEIFSRLFRPYADKSVEQLRAELKRDASVLDLMLDDSRSLKGRLGHADQQKLDEYLESLRAIEQRVDRTTQWTHKPLPTVDPSSVKLDVNYQKPVEYTRCLYDLLFLALQTDSTRFASFMLESEQSTSSEVGKFATYAFGYPGQTHDIAHKRPEESGRWDRWRAEQHAYFLDRLRRTPEGEGNMLDRTVVLWGSAHPHGSHSAKNYPLHLAGGNALGFRHGKLHAFEGSKKVPMANLFVSILNAVDVPVERFADSTGGLTDLRA